MVQGPMLLIILIVAISFIIYITAKVNLHAFLFLLLASFGVGIFARGSLIEVVNTITDGFGGVLSYIVIIFGAIIRTILEKSNATSTMANTVLCWVGEAKSALAMSITGAIISIPVFCDSDLLFFHL